MKLRLRSYKSLVKMEIEFIAENIAVSPQIKPETISELKELGFKTIVCNRPDGEEANQPSFAEIESACNKNNIKAVYIPIINGPISYATVDEFRQCLLEVSRPVLAYCRSGARSKTVFSLVQ